MMSTWCSKHVEAWNKLIVKQKFCASRWLITKIYKENKHTTNYQRPFASILSHIHPCSYYIFQLRGRQPASTYKSNISMRNIPSIPIFRLGFYNPGKLSCGMTHTVLKAVDAGLQSIFRCVPHNCEKRLQASVCPPACYNSPPTGWIFMKMNIWILLFFFEISVNPSAWGHLNPSSYCDVGRLFYGVFKLWSKLQRKKWRNNF